MTASADEALVVRQETRLEREHAAFVLGLAHQADVVMGVRSLDSGAAGDVSGVLRITSGGGDADGVVEERELLYHVSGDGAARVFERGE